MKKWLLRIAGVFGLLVLLLAALVAWNQTDYQRFTRYVQNEELRIVKPGWPGNALDQNDRFMDTRNPFLPKTMELLKWKLGGETFEEERRLDPWRPEVTDPSAFLTSEEDGILWLGHASFYIRLGGVGILTDPVIGEPALLRRVVPVSSALE